MKAHPALLLVAAASPVYAGSAADKAIGGLAAGVAAAVVIGAFTGAAWVFKRIINGATQPPKSPPTPPHPPSAPSTKTSEP